MANLPDMKTTKNVRLAVLALALCSAICGCSSNKDMRERFSDDVTRILTDEAGRKYIAKHHIGDTYTLTPYEPEKLK